MTARQPRCCQLPQGWLECIGIIGWFASEYDAWMKANHPEAFLAGCMSLAVFNTDKLAALRQECARMGIAVAPPDINRSGVDFILERDESGKLVIRYALAAVKKVGQSAMEALVALRGATQFTDLADFAARVDDRVPIRGVATALLSRVSCSIKLPGTAG